MRAGASVASTRWRSPKAGAKIVVNDLGGSTAGEGADATPAQQVADEIKAMGGEATANYDNVADFQGAENMVKQAVGDFGRLDILVNNAGILRDRMLVSMTEDEWDAVIAVHLKGHFAPTHHAAAYWRAAVEGGQADHGPRHQHLEPVRCLRQRRSDELRRGQGRHRGVHDHRGAGAGSLRRHRQLSRSERAHAHDRETSSVRCRLRPRASTTRSTRRTSRRVVVALATDEAQDITGQCFFVYGGVINVLKPWDVGTFVTRTTRSGTRTSSLRQLKESFPNGIAPEGMMPMMGKASGQG